MNLNPKENSVEEHRDATGQGDSQMEEFRLVQQLFNNSYLLIRWFLVRHLNTKDVMRLTSVTKLVNDIIFSRGNFKKLNFEHFI